VSYQIILSSSAERDLKKWIDILKLKALGLLLIFQKILIKQGSD